VSAVPDIIGFAYQEATESSGVFTVGPFPGEYGRQVPRFETPLLREASEGSAAGASMTVLIPSAIAAVIAVAAAV